ncbi:MAG TPA: 4-(cytidine 5'-diphospho)-2-C-methyl-D-erythritol kinase [Eubacteriaceae bacterium]|nr:4-(cytidine 5'-diphospho)-2-C-methyl-D-erythritol kinase [Eubacteriaceae bacterium]
MNRFSVMTPAKINLTLDIIKKREDGYHEISMVMQTVDLCDELEFEERESQIEIECTNDKIPCDRGNLVYKAAKALKEEFDIKKGVYIKINKRIPLEAGLAGGSSNAAGTLIALKKLWDIRISEERLNEIAKSIGADVPYCTQGGTMLAEGIGEKLTRLKNLPDYQVVLVKPNFTISTAWAYNNVDIKNIKKHPDNEAVSRAIEYGDRAEIEKNLGNVFEQAAFKKYPELAGIKKALTELGAKGSLMSGSGPTVYGLFDDEAKAESAWKHFREIYDEVYKAKTCHQLIKE